MGKKERRRPRIAERNRVLREEARRRAHAQILEGDPVKQYVRQHGWLEVVRDYVERRRRAGVERPIRYLTLPGENASDILLLWHAGLLRRTATGFPDVAICDLSSAGQVQVRLGSFLAVSDKPLWEAVGGPDSELAHAFPFDVINYDATHALITGSASVRRAIRKFEPIRWILRLQRGQGFLLLLTSRPDRGARQMLYDLLVDNLEKHTQFKDRYQRQYGQQLPEDFVQNYTRFSQLMLPKLIAKAARNLGYQTREHFAARYSRRSRPGGRSYDMITHSLEFEPVGVKPINRYKHQYTRVPEDDVVCEDLSQRVQTKCMLAYTEFIASLVLREPLDVIQVLDADQALRREMAAQARSLLGFDNPDAQPGVGGGA